MNSPLSTIKNAIICGPNAIMWAAIVIQWIAETTHYILMKNWMMMGLGLAIIFWALGKTLEYGSSMLFRLDVIRTCSNLPENRRVGESYGGLKIDRVFGVIFGSMGLFLIFAPPVNLHYTIGGSAVFIAGALMWYSGTHEIAL
jgi:hypothetical protein